MVSGTFKHKEHVDHIFENDELGALNYIEEQKKIDPSYKPAKYFIQRFGGDTQYIVRELKDADN